MNVSQKLTARYMRFILSVFGLILFSGTLMAQNIRITGKVTDNNNQPLAGVYVLIEGTRTGMSTDFDGNYTINAPGNATLVFSSIGMQTLSVAVNNRSVVNVTMVDDTMMFDDVVVTALGIKKERKALGYAVQDIKSAELMKNKSANVINSLSGKIAGVNVTQGGGAAGTGSTIIIRGGTSLERDNQPVFVVDGVIYDNSTPIGGNTEFEGTSRTSTSNSNRVMDINPEDIENMSVLKGPAAAALYGSRAAAGVVIITTKKGQEGNVQINFGSKFSTNWVNRFPEQQSTYKRGYFEERTGVFNDYTTQSWGEKFGAGDKIYNNIEDFFQNGTQWDNTISVSGGSKTGTFYLSASRFDQKGIIPTTGYDKTTFRFNGDQKYGILTVGANMAYSIANTDKTLTSAGLWGSGGTGTMVSAYRWARSDDMNYYLNPDGSKYRMFAGRQNLEDDIENPYWILNKNSMSDKTNRFNGSLFANIDAAEWLDISYRLGYDNYTTLNNSFVAPGSVMRATYQNGKLSDSDLNYEYLSSNLMFNFNKKVGDFDLGLLLGQTIEETNTLNNMRNAWDFVIDGFYSYDNVPEMRREIRRRETHKRLMGLYGEFRVSYKNIAYLTVTGRNDWTSTLPKDDRSYFYPSVSGSLVFTELLPKSDVLSFGKIRASWAKVGKDTNPYELVTTLWPSLTFLGGLGVGNHWQRGNPYLVPEMTSSFEVGLEARFFNGRFGLDYTYYSNNSSNLISAPRLSQATGYILLSTNVGNIINRGMELSLNVIPIDKRDFRWDMTLNLSGNRGTVKNLLKGQEILYVTDVQVGTAKAASFNTTYDENGNILQKGVFNAISGTKFNRDSNGNIILDANTGMPTYSTSAAAYVGNRESTFTGGFNNDIRYKNWNFSFLFDIRVGGDIYNGTEGFMTTAGMSKRSENRESITIEGVVSDGSGGYTPKTFTYQAGQMYNIQTSTGTVPTSGSYLIRNYYQILENETATYITDTNWLRLRAISLSYDFTSLLKNTRVIKGLSATVSGTNLWLLTNYKGMDPETSVAGSGVIGSGSGGIDYCGVPATAGLSFGINLSF